MKTFYNILQIYIIFLTLVILYFLDITANYDIGILFLYAALMVVGPSIIVEEKDDIVVRKVERVEK